MCYPPTGRRAACLYLSGVFVVCLTAPGDAQERAGKDDYYPLRPGSVWTRRERGDAGELEYKTEIAGVETVGGTTWAKVVIQLSSPPTTGHGLIVADER
ncbi:MAG TPA: hypothetical protein VH092_31465, partial [Urbifossiella sp.]|nr:hypothetical protein [Urbifossiella sp.]